MKTKTKSHSGFTLLEIMIVVAIIGILAAIVIPGFKNAIDTSQKSACGLNRKQIDGAKARWALENKQPPMAEPTDADLFGAASYLDHKPECPASGSYALNAVEKPCTCSVPPHVN
jgi:prepilin-type N-terminal cleavage/methylation domain-containing protein